MCSRPVFACKTYIMSEIDDTEMDLATAILVLKQHQAWRTDNTGELRMVKPETIGKALRVAIACMERVMQDGGPAW